MSPRQDDAGSADNRSVEKTRKDKNVVPLNSDYDRCRLGKADKAATSSTAKPSDRRVLRAGNGGLPGLAVGN